MRNSFDGGQIGESATVEHEIINVQFDERLHLVNDLPRRPNEVFAGLELRASDDDPGNLSFGGSVCATAAPCAPDGRGIAVNLNACALKLS